MARTALILITALLIFSCATLTSNAQSGKSYEFIPAPDVWYNDVDGIRMGLRLKGQVPGTFEDGPHRLDAGLWLGTWFPDLPVSYYISFTEPIPSWSEFGSEANVQAISSIRTGYSRHGVGFNKRWQQGFDERRFREISLFSTYEKRFDREYTAFPVRWSDQDKVLTTFSGLLQNENSLGFYTLSVEGSAQLLNNAYTFGSITAIQRVPLSESWGIKLRGFAGTSSSSADPEYLFSRSAGQAIESLTSGVTRAKGTIPQPWRESGNFHVEGGPNLRGYTQQDIELFQQAACVECVTDGSVNEAFGLFHSVAAVNAELDYPNPVKSLFNQLPYVADFITLRSYLFLDAGSTFGEDNTADQFLADAGAGFALSLNIPDYLGKPRGFVIRYDIPFWVSDPDSGDSFKYRSLFGFGAIISF